MRSRLLRRIRDTARGEEGVVLVAVILTSLVLSLMAVAALGYATAQMPQARDQQDRAAALAAAESGIEDYLMHVNRDTEYVRRGFVDPDNPAFGGFVALPGRSDGTAEYRIDDVDVSALASTGRVSVVATGRVQGVQRTVKVALARKLFTDYAYMSDLEVNDPRNFGKYPRAGGDDAKTAELEQRCAVYEWQNRVTSSSGKDDCGELYWYSGDVLNGKLHTNDLVVIGGSPRFNDHVESGCQQVPGCGDLSGGVYKNFHTQSGSATFKYPSDGNGFGVSAGGVLEFPPNNQKLSLQAQAPNAGCLFTGPTRIVLKGTYAEVYSRNSKVTNGAACGGSADGGFKRIVPMQSTGLVIYVQNIPAAPGDPNYTAPGTEYSTVPFIPGPRPADAPADYRPDPASGTRIATPDGFPLPEDLAGKAPNQRYFGPRQGDVLVEGTLDGALTIGAEDDIFITSDLLQQDRSRDLLGLVANNFIWNYHPVSGTGRGEQYELCDGGCMKDVKIQAALMSVKHSYGTTYPASGASQGTIHLSGSLVQRWRNNVGNGTFGVSSGPNTHSGYAKDYAYDPKLRFTQPPHFLQPESLQWGVNRWAELSSP